MSVAGWSRLGIGAAVVAAALAGGCLGESTRPGPIPPDTVAFVSAHVGALHACGLTAAGAAYCWGANGVGQLGVGDFDDRPVPHPVAQGTARFRVLAPGAAHSCGITTDGETQCWGLNERGQLGTGAPTFPEAQPVPVGGGHSFVVVATGGAHSCALTADGAAWCWGLAQSGRLGNGISGADVIRPTPDSVLSPVTLVAITVGDNHTCALAAGGEAYCWGAGEAGQLGTGDVANENRPAPVTGGLAFATITAGGLHTCALATDGSAYCWGENSSGQLGDGTTSRRLAPTAVAGGLRFTALSAGGAHTCGVTADGSAYCWGRNDSGQLGDGTETDRRVPTPVSGGLRFINVGAGQAPFTTASCGYATDGLIYCWGYGPDGQLGDGTNTNSTTPVRVAGQLEP